MDDFDAIYRRKSIRKYLDEELHVGIIEELKDAVKSAKRLYEDIDMDIHVVEDGRKMQNVISGIIGSYGKIRAPHYIIATSEIKEGYLENIGYALEPIVLKLTDMGIGTCWIGGTVKKQLVKQVIDIKERHVPVVVIAFGYPKDEDDITKKALKSRNRKDISELIMDDMGITWQYIIDAARMAPSSLNSQPWRFSKKDNIVDVYSIKRKGIFTKHLKNMNLIDIGIALAHIDIASEKYDRDIHFEKLTQRDSEGLVYVTSVVDETEE